MQRVTPNCHGEQPLETSLQPGENLIESLLPGPELSEIPWLIVCADGLLKVWVIAGLGNLPTQLCTCPYFLNGLMA